MQEAMTCIWRKQKDHSFEWSLLVRIRGLAFSAEKAVAALGVPMHTHSLPLQSSPLSTQKIRAEMSYISALIGADKRT